MKNRPYAGRVQFQVQFGEFGGSYVNHCHNTVHEDFAMLLRLQLLSANGEQMGITDTKRVYTSDDLACGKNIIFAATGVTDGSLLKGVRFFGDGIRTSSIVMQNNPHRIRFIDSIQVYAGPAVRIRF